MKTTWRLPKGVDELLPPAAWELETLRRRVLDLFVSWGFEYLESPLIEYLDSLLVGGGEDLDLQTLKVVDQVSGKQLGVRADMTAQAVRVDAHSRPREGCSACVMQALSYLPIRASRSNPACPLRLAPRYSAVTACMPTPKLCD